MILIWIIISSDTKKHEPVGKNSETVFVVPLTTPPIKHNCIKTGRKIYGIKWILKYEFNPSLWNLHMTWIQCDKYIRHKYWDIYMDWKYHL